MSTPSSPPEGRTRGGKPRGSPQLFDFRRPTTLSREHVRTMQIVQETLARGFTTTLASALRAVVNVSIFNIEQRPYDEYVRNLPNPTVLTMLSLRPLPGLSILQMPLPVAYAATELLLGGSGGAIQPKRPMTDLELSLMRGIVELSLPEIRYAFESVVSIEPSVIAQESNPQFAQLAAPSDMVIIASFEVRIEAVTDVMTLCIPFSSLQPHLEALSDSNQDGEEDTNRIAAEKARIRTHVEAAEVEARATFRPTTATSQQIVDLEVGDLLLLNHPVGLPLTLQADAVPVLDVTIGRLNRHLAVQVAGQVPSDRQRRGSRLQVIPAAAPPH
ncbi:MAG: flagellar motor switch protein FliM [Ilumatobacteraceae bacterium]|nr:flagellar motor switch protein FliM [Ilumatobacteraceae bacterium]